MNIERRRATLALVVGPMFANKTGRLIELYEQVVAQAGTACVIVRPAADTRSEPGHVTTHEGRSVKAVVLEDLGDFEAQAGSFTRFTHVFVDEAQFFPRLFAFCRTAMRNRVSLVVAGLDATYEHKPWPETETTTNVLNLVPWAESVEKRTAPCRWCGYSAGFTRALCSIGQPRHIGADESYAPSCFGCLERPVGDALGLDAWRELARTGARHS